MTTVPAGWYPDPDPAAPSAGERWWDGARWTDRVHLPLAGWWWRALAVFMDGLVLGIVSGVVTFPVQLDLQRELQVELSRFRGPIERGDPDAPGDFVNAILDVYADHLVGLLVAPVLLTVLYHVVFLRSLGATPGKLMCGLRVRLRESGGRLPWSAIGARFSVQFVLAWGVLAAAFATLSFAALGVAYLVVFFFSIVDAMWAVGARRQTLHDLAARTIVVKTR